MPQIHPFVQQKRPIARSNGLHSRYYWFVMPNVTAVLKLIAETVRKLANDGDFRDWLRSVRAVVGDGILVNNSFLFREQLKTRKSELYPLLEVGRSGALNDLP